MKAIRTSVQVFLGWQRDLDLSASTPQRSPAPDRRVPGRSAWKLRLNPAKNRPSRSEPKALPRQSMANAGLTTLQPAWVEVAAFAVAVLQQTHPKSQVLRLCF